MQVWRHPTDDTIRVQFDEDDIIELGHWINTHVDDVPGDWIELVPEPDTSMLPFPDNGLAESNGWLAHHSPPEDRP